MQLARLEKSSGDGTRELNNQIEALKAEKEAAVKELESKIAALEKAWAEREQELQAQLDAKASSVTELQEELCALKKTLEQLQDTLKAAKEKEAGLEKELAAQKAKFEEVCMGAIGITLQRPVFCGISQCVGVRVGGGGGESIKDPRYICVVYPKEFVRFNVPPDVVIQNNPSATDNTHFGGGGG